MSNHIFWLDEPSILYSHGNYSNIIPNANMTRIEQLNAGTRLCLLIIIIALLFGKFGIIIYIPLIVIIFLVILYNLYRFDPDGKLKEFEFEKKIYKSNDNKYANKDKVIESGYYDFDGKLNIGPEYDVFSNKNTNDFYYTPQDIEQYNKETCKKPTIDNPFMNPLVTELNTEMNISACNADDEDIQNDINDKFDTNLYKDIDDLFNTRNSQRTWYTIPNQSNFPDPNDSFRNWTYKQNMTCKEDQTSCLKYEDLRYKRQL